MPADQAFLQVYDFDLQAMRTIVAADSKSGESVDLLTPFSDTARESLKRATENQAPDTFIINEPDKYPVSRELLSFHNVKAFSLIVMTLMAKGKPVGGLVLASESEELFTDYHKELIISLKQPFTIALSNALHFRDVSALKDALAEKNQFLENELSRQQAETIIGANFGLKTVMDQAGKVAKLNTSVLVLGETGVGKNVIANAIHQLSERRNGPFISVNCGAIPENLIDSELFGHEKGAFTGAVERKMGRFERAQQGTIFLDEIGELPLNLQVRLLRVLQNKEIERVGGIQTIPLDVRIIAATNQDLEKLVNEKKFREDLWFRLNVFPITVPPLRQRRSDIPALVQHFITKKTVQLNLPFLPELKPDAVKSLLDYNWPGNIRELENIIERALILNNKKELSFEDVLFPVSAKAQDFNYDSGLTLDEIMKQYIVCVLEKTQGKIHGPNGAAEILGINSSTLRNKMNKLGIEYRKR